MDPVDVWRDKSQLMCDFGVVEMFDSWGHEAPAPCIHTDGVPPPLIRVDAHSVQRLTSRRELWFDRSTTSSAMQAGVATT